VEQLPKKTDALITLAQSSNFRKFPQKAREVFEVNVTSNLKLLDWAVKTKVQKVIHASSGGVYGGKLDFSFQETDNPEMLSPLGFYLCSKMCSELVFQNYAQFFKTLIILRPFFIYGPGQKEEMFIARIINSIRNQYPVALQGENGLKVNPVYVEDAVQAFRASLSLKGCEIINIAGPEILTLREISDIIGQLVNTSPIFNHNPGIPTDYLADISTAKEKIDFNPISFKDGISKVIGHKILNQYSDTTY
jgi:nucleoside-diphosphate-sugar epimerase